MSDVAKFTLRFRNEKNHEILGVLAKRRGISKNQLAEEMLEREVAVAAGHGNDTDRAAAR